MYDDQEPLSAAPPTLDPREILAAVRGPNADEFLAGLSWDERTIVADALKRALVDHELSGSFTTPDLMSAFQRVGGTESELDAAVLGTAAARRDQVNPSGLAVVWARLIRVEETLTEGEIRSWLAIDMIRGLAAKSATWTRFTAIELGDWARNELATRAADALAQQLIAKHPNNSAAVLAQAMREDPHGATRLMGRLDEKTVVTLASAVVDDASLPTGLRLTLASRAGEAVKARARAMVVRELDVTDETMAALSPGEAPEARAANDREEMSPATRRLAWSVAGVAFFLGSLLGLGFGPGFFLSAAMFVIAWYMGREPEGDE
ncbi:MAG TPA: hypothetical protein VLI04_16920 [Nocardioidaceae bacterium]|nr:hypothetical protein [Nocardioidaceae bacterium]